MDSAKHVRESWSRLVIAGSRGSYSLTSEEAAVSEEEEGIGVDSARSVLVSGVKTLPHTRVTPPSLPSLGGACLILYASPSKEEVGFILWPASIKEDSICFKQAVSSPGENYFTSGLANVLYLEATFLKPSKNVDESV